jgi:hypothetical protein
MIMNAEDIDEVALLRKRVAELEGMRDGQPMNEAPYDGTQVLLYFELNKGGFFAVGWWGENENSNTPSWLDNIDGEPLGSPLRWWRLPTDTTQENE